MISMISFNQEFGKDGHERKFITRIKQDLEIAGLKAGDIVKVKNGRKLGIVVGFWNNEYLTYPLIWVLEEGKNGIGYYREIDVAPGRLEFVRRIDSPDLTPKGLRKSFRKEVKERSGRNKSKLAFMY